MNVENKLIDLDAYSSHPRNYNAHSDAQIARIMASLSKFDQPRSVVVWNGMFLAGHGVAEAARRLGWKQIRADVLPDDYPESLALGYVVADNELARQSDPDQAALAAILQEVTRDDGDMLQAVGFDDAMLAELLRDVGGAAAAVDAEPQIDKADELQQVWQTELGQMWLLDSGKGHPHRLICGDCTDLAVVARVMGGERADMMFTDPPYGVGYTGGHFHSGNVNIKREREPLANDDNPAIYAQFLPVVLPFVDGPCYVWFAASVGKPVYDAILGNNCEIHAMIIWHKINATYAAMNAQYKQRHEPCMYFKPKKSTLRWVGPSDECTIWEIKRDSVNEHHPTQKPIELALRAMGNHAANVILDCFAGSGSTCIACESLGRQARMVELDAGYCAVILQRWADATGHTPALMGSP